MGGVFIVFWRAATFRLNPVFQLLSKYATSLPRGERIVQPMDEVIDLGMITISVGATLQHNEWGSLSEGRTFRFVIARRTIFVKGEASRKPPP